MKSFIRKPWYPFLFAIYPIIYLYSRNFRIIAAGEPVRPLLISLGMAGLFFLCFQVILKDWHRPALLATLITLLFFSFGHAVNQVEQWAARGFFSVRMGWLGLLWLAAFFLLSFLIMRSRRASALAPLLNIFSAALILLSGLTIAATVYSIRREIPNQREQLAQARGEKAAEQSAIRTQGKKQDIYYIILDSYERADALQKYYHFDNSAFITALKQRGFYVAEQSRSNYLTTVYSVPSSLNMIYLNDLPTNLFIKVTTSLEDNHVRGFLESRGYQTVRFESGFGLTDAYPADHVVAPAVQAQAPAAGPNQFEILLLQTTVGRLMFSQEPAKSKVELETDEVMGAAIQQDFDRRREHILNTFTHLPDYAAKDGSYFLFAHILAPHNPYLWGANGEKIDYNGNFYLLGDKTNSERNVRLYNDQLQYTNKLVLQAIDRILAESKAPPIIILQADHGHDTYFEWDALTTDGLDLRSGILNAYYFPGGDYAALYPSISPVNTFRVVFNQYFGANYPLLPDRTYTHPHPNNVPVGTKPTLTDICPRYLCSPERIGGR